MQTLWPLFANGKENKLKKRFVTHNKQAQN
jgi:hypothetical protein